jgi:hypothetical protein
MALDISLDPPGLASISIPEAEPGVAGERSEGEPSRESR